MTAVALKTNYAVDPLGLGDTTPNLSWRIEADGRRGARQTKYQIVAASSPEKLEEPDLWDSGEIESDETSARYAGSKLQSRSQVSWRVRTWDERGEAGAWSETATFEIGLLQRSDWQGQWIGADVAGGRYTIPPAPYIRREFSLDKPVASARLYASALGLYECELNGVRVGDLEFTPGWTDYNVRVQYQVYDVTSLLQSGENAWGAILGDGWYAGCVDWRGRQRYGDKPKFIGQLEVTFSDGSKQIITSDEQWTTKFGPILGSDMQQGESYDANQEMPGWSTAGFDAVTWKPVTVQPDDDPALSIELTAMQGPGVKATEEITPISITRREAWPQPVWIIDMGQNMVGRVRLNIPAEAKPWPFEQGDIGRTITMRFGETLDTDGSLYTANLRYSRQTDHYEPKPGDQQWESRFTFHGFRYIELAGLGEVTPQTVTGIVLHSDMEKTGDFECSEPLINQLQKNIDWGFRGNAVDVPTDCPQRDERLGWTGDAQVFVRTATYNRDVAGFFRKWQQDLRDSQAPSGSIPPVAPDTGIANKDGGPAWSDAVVICPWTIYLAYGDKNILSEHYASMKQFISYLDSTSDGDLRRKQGYGDWLSIKAETPLDLIATAFYAHSTDLVGRIAGVLGHEEEARFYQGKFEKIRAAFVREFVSPAGRVGSGSQTSYLLALNFNLLPEELKTAATNYLVLDIESRCGKLSTGFVGSPYLARVLSDNGRADIAYQLLHVKECPSWLYAVTQGATTIWEHWDGWTAEKGFQDVTMNSFNHYAYGAVGTWLYTTVAGIDLDESEPSHKKVILHPLPGGGLNYAKGHLDSVHGRIESGWKVDGDLWTWNVTLPPNTTAVAHFPTASVENISEAGQTLEQVEGVGDIRSEAGKVVVNLTSGTYQFTVKNAELVKLP